MESLAGHEADSPVWDDDDLDAIESLMSEAPAAGNHGRKAASRRASTTPGKPGERWGNAYNSLSPDDHAVIALIAGGGATVASEYDLMRDHGAVSGLRPGRPTTLSAEELAGSDRAALRAAALERLGFTEADMALLDGPGAGALKFRDLRDRFDAACLHVKETSGRSTDLARALGWHVRTAPDGRNPQCDRMKKCLRRARDRREAAAASDAA